jgi:GT2 family glycosyltransferase/glycosyltransferase involved in cell wall biosynthesis
VTWNPSPHEGSTALEPLRPVTLILLTWNRWALTRRCLETLLTTDLAGAELLVVDNGSTDGTSERLAAFPQARVLPLGENLGFVRGNNAGIAAAPPEHDIVLLNNDLEFHRRDWLQRLRAAAAATPDAGIVGCRQVLSDGRLLHAGTYILPDTMWGQQIGALEHDVGQFTGRREVQGITFAVAYLKREVIAAIGGLSEDFQSYFEDTDYCLRARQAGFRTIFAGDAQVVHDEHGSTAGDDSGRRSLFERSRAVFRDKWKTGLESEYGRDLVWQSILNFPTGYARSSRAYLHELDHHLGVRCVYRYVYGKGSPFKVEEPENTGDYYLNVVRGREMPRGHSTSGSAAPAVSVVYGQGDVFRRAVGKVKVGFTMLEVDGFPRDWVEQANEMDEVWVPSEFNRQGFLDSGLKRPIHLIPLGVDTDYFHPGARRLSSPTGEFVFLANFEWGERKDPWLLLRAFNETFRADEPVRLLCKISNRDPLLRLKAEIRNLGLNPGGGKISYLLNLDFPHAQLPMLYRSADCFLAVSRGEGWDMPLMEAMACGLPTIATDWSSHTEFVNDAIGYRLRVAGTIPAVAKCPYYTGFRWAQADEGHLRTLLRHVFEHQDEARAKGAAAAREMAAKWTWRQAAEKIVARLAVLAP